MLKDAMPGGTLMANGGLEKSSSGITQHAAPAKETQELAERLEKSEAGRKKLRQAIALLKEKAEANEKVLQVNEILRRDREKYKLSAEAERIRAEEEKSLREQIEKEGLSTKEQLLRVVQRLDAWEHDRKSDHDEIERMKKETEQAVTGFYKVIKTLEDAHLSIEGLEKNLFVKVSSAISASEESSSLAQTSINDAKKAQGTAAAAESLSRSLVSRTKALEERSATLAKKLSLLQEEQHRKIQVPTENQIRGNGNSIPSCSSSPSRRKQSSVVHSKSQQQPSTGPFSPQMMGCVAEYDCSKPKLGRAQRVSTVKAASTSVKKDPRTSSLTSKSRHSSTVLDLGIAVDTNAMKRTSTNVCKNFRTDRQGGDVSMNVKLLQDSISPNVPQVKSVRDALDAARSRRELLSLAPGDNSTVRSTSIQQKVYASRSVVNPVQAPENHADDPEGHKGRTKFDGDNGAVLTVSRTKKIENSSPVPLKNSRRSSRHCNALGASEVKQWSVRADEIAAETECVITPRRTGTRRKSEVSKSGEAVAVSGPREESLAMELLKGIKKLSEKEKKSRGEMERKLFALERILADSNEQEGRTPALNISGENTKKRKRKSLSRSGKKVRSEEIEEISNLTSNKPVTWSCRDSGSEAVEIGEGEVSISHINGSLADEGLVAGASVLSEPGEFKDVDAEDGANPVKDGNVLYTQDLGSECVSASPCLFVEGCKAASTTVLSPCRETELDGDGLKERSIDEGWFLDSEISEDELGCDWWANKPELLSPNLPEISPPPPLLEVQKAGASWVPDAGEFSSQGNSLLDSLPHIEKEECDHTELDTTLIDGELAMYSNDSAMAHSRRDCTNNDGPSESSDCIHGCQDGGESNRSIQYDNTETTSSEKPADCEAHLKDKSTEEPGSANMGLGRPTVLAVLVQEDNDPCEKSSKFPCVSTCNSGATLQDVLREGAYGDKREDLFRVHSTKCDDGFCPFSLELVMGHMGDGSKGHSAACSPSVAEISKKISVAFGRTQRILHGALTHCNADVRSSSAAVASQVASALVSSKFPELDLICIFTASLVDSHALWDIERTTARSVFEDESLQLLIEVVKEVFVTEVFQNVLPAHQAFLAFVSQLQAFLIRGEVAVVQDLFPSETSGGSGNGGSIFHFIPSTSKGLMSIISGSKLLAAYFEIIGKPEVLRNCIYLVLRFCVLDSLSLLATISSFACVCCESLFTISEEDLIGQCVRVVISELLNDVLEGSKRRSESDNVQQGSDCTLEPFIGLEVWNARTKDVVQFPANLSSLRQVIGNDDGLSFEAFVPRILEQFYSVIAPTFGSSLPSQRHLFQRKAFLLQAGRHVETKSKDGNAVGSPQKNETDSVISSTINTAATHESASPTVKANITKTLMDLDYWRSIRTESDTPLPQIGTVDQTELQATNIDEWEQKFYDITNALELVSTHLGWEWTYNDLILEHMWSLIVPGAPEMTVACVAYVFGLLGCLGREAGNSDLPGIDELRKALLAILTSDPSTSFSSGPSRAQVAAAESLLMLISTTNKENVMVGCAKNVCTAGGGEIREETVKTLQTWLMTLSSDAQAILPPALKCALPSR